MLTIILAAITKFLLGLISLAALIAIIVSVVTGQPLAHAPTAASASITTDEDTTSAPVTPSVTDPDAGDTFTFSIVTQPANGAAAVVNNQLVYTPAPNYNGPDSFTFRATDSTNLNVVGTASVTVLAVNDMPSVADLSNFNGQDSFTFRATDSGGLSAVGTANVTVAPVADAPSATHAGITARAGTPSSAVTPYVEDADLWETFSHQFLSTPANGTASVIGNKLVYVSNPGFFGPDSFNYRVTDSAGLTVDGTALVHVFGSGGLSRCTSPSIVNTDATLNARTVSGACGFYGEVT